MLYRNQLTRLRPSAAPPPLTSRGEALSSRPMLNRQTSVRLPMWVSCIYTRTAGGVRR